MNQIPQEEHNALWHLFSAEKKKVFYGSQHYKIRSKLTSTILNQLFFKYKLEGIIDMPYTTEDFKHDVALEHLPSLSIDERLQGLPFDEVIRRFPLHERLQGLSTDEVVKNLPPEEVVKTLPTEMRLKGMSIKEIELYLEQMKASKPDSDKK